MERYYWFRSIRGPANQNGLALKVTQDSIIDMANMLRFKRLGNKTYVADTNVDLWGSPHEKRDPVKFSIEKNSSLRIRQQPSGPIYLTEITEEEAKRVANRTEILRDQQTSRVISLTPNIPDLNYYI